MVIRGLLTTAGSSFIFVKIIGNKLPIKFANKTIIITDIPATWPTAAPPFQKELHSQRTPPSVTPNKRPTSSSLFTTPNQFLRLKSPMAMALMTRVADCVPVLPPQPINTGMKKAKATMAVKVSSKAATTLAERKSATSRRDNHTIRFRYKVQTEAVL